MNNKGTQSGNYKVPNSSSGKISAPNTIIKHGNSPKKTTGGDLRSRGSK